MTDKPILFSGPMVRALLEGRKTQTRRVLCEADPTDDEPEGYRDLPAPYVAFGFPVYERPDDGGVYRFPKSYATGDRLWVRETWNVPDAYLSPENRATAIGIMNYRATPWAEPGAWRPSIFMPRWASRLTLTVTDVRVQRLQEISTDDAKSEGIPEFAEDADRIGLPAVSGIDGCEWDNRSSVENFRLLWDTLNAKRGYGWEANPWVAAYTFTVHRQNIDQMERAA